MKIDKLERYTRVAAVVSGASGDCWRYTLRPSDLASGTTEQIENFYRTHGVQRAIFRQHIRDLCSRKYQPTQAARMLATLYNRLGFRRGYIRYSSSPVYALISRRLWTLRHGAWYGVECV